ncbi:MAG: hypothetical protein RL456_1806 [Pseudomonadota bacterium]|jgi:capsid protein
MLRQLVSGLTRIDHAVDRVIGRTATWALRSFDWTAEKIWTGQGAGYWSSTNPLRKVIEGWRPKRASINRALHSDLSTLVAQGRHLDRAMPVYRGLVEGHKAELVGSGIGVEPDTGDKGLDRALRDLWSEVARNIGVHGESLWTLQRMACGEIDNAGGTIWRGLVLPERLDEDMLSPWCILVQEYEWLADAPVSPIDPGNIFTAGVETDRLGRARYLHLRSPDDPFAPGERLPISQCKHIFEARWPRQAVGAPRLATLIERTFQDDEIVNNEMKAARVAGALAVIIADDELRAAYLAGNLPPDFMDVEGGTVSIIGSTSKATAFTHDRPSPNTREWRDTVKGDLAAGAGVSRVWTDRDGQRYNFANSKFDQIRSQMMARMQQDWFGDGVASWPYEQSLPWMMLRLGRSMPTSKNELRRLKRHRLVPDIPPELDELSAAKAFEAGSRNGIDSRADFLGRRGRDPEAIAKQIDAEARDDAARAAERIAVAQRLCEELNAKDPSLKLHWSHIVTLPGAKTAPGAYLQAAAPQAETSATGDQPPA